MRHGVIFLHPCIRRNYFYDKMQDDHGTRSPRENAAIKPRHGRLSPPMGETRDRAEKRKRRTMRVGNRRGNLYA